MKMKQLEQKGAKKRVEKKEVAQVLMRLINMLSMVLAAHYLAGVIVDVLRRKGWIASPNETAS